MPARQVGRLTIDDSDGVTIRLGEWKGPTLTVRQQTAIPVVFAVAALLTVTFSFITGRFVLAVPTAAAFGIVGGAVALRDRRLNPSVRALIGRGGALALMGPNDIVKREIERSAIDQFGVGVDGKSAVLWIQMDIEREPLMWDLDKEEAQAAAGALERWLALPHEPYR